MRSHCFLLGASSISSVKPSNQALNSASVIGNSFRHAPNKRGRPSFPETALTPSTALPRGELIAPGWIIAVTVPVIMIVEAPPADSISVEDLHQLAFEEFVAFRQRRSRSSIIVLLSAGRDAVNIRSSHENPRPALTPSLRFPASGRNREA